MLRRFTQDVGRWKSGVLHDWPLTTWMHIARETGKPLDEISKPEEMSDVLVARNRGRQKLRSRASSNGRAATAR